MMQNLDYRYVLRQSDQDEMGGHRGIYRAISDGDAEKAKAAMENHIRNLIRDVEAMS